MFVKKIDLIELKKLKTDSVFSTVEWLSIFTERNLHINGIFNKNKELIGCFFYDVKKQAKILNHLSSLPYTPHCGLFIKSEVSNPANKNTFNKKVLKLVEDSISKENKQIVTLEFPIDFIDMQSFSWKNYKVIPSYTYCIDLSKTEEQIHTDFSPKTRNTIKKAVKDGLTFEKVNDYNITKELVLSSLNRNDALKDESLLGKILFEYANGNNSFSYVVFNGDTPVATTFCIYDKNRCYYLLGGYDENNRHPGGGAMAVWEAIKEAKRLKIKEFDFEGSMLAPVESYFRSFGGELIPFYTINKANFAIELLLKKKKRSHF
jgi:lipid II:glycine glycyltransferase (peptidoglycan interpeptide bridge formation enzyme)